MSAGWTSQRLVLPSISVKRKVNAPEGATFFFSSIIEDEFTYTAEDLSNRKGVPASGTTAQPAPIGRV
ncbi:MAG: hypothetical protein A2001_14670 [Treponema sp. GWC1_61_84]|nr:MAG: hypothetical protein A2001_14670 [Treponema sp. GWC1_61_84]